MRLIGRLIANGFLRKRDNFFIKNFMILPETMASSGKNWKCPGLGFYSNFCFAKIF